MLNFIFSNCFFLISYIIFFISIWISFIKNNFYYVRINPGSSDILKNSNFLKKINYNFYTIFFIYIYTNYIIYNNFFKFDFFINWFNHFKLNNFILNLIFIIIIINCLVFFLIKLYKNKNINFNIDYFFALFNLSLFIPLMYISNTIYTFIFMLEINSILILYKFAVSKYTFSTFSKNNKNIFIKNSPKNYINMVFFQYWINFFSSIILFYAIFSFLVIFGTSEWILINIFNKFNINIVKNINYLFYGLLCFIFLFGMFTKIGLTPTHLFKIEVYKGIPFISILFYTVFYFISFFLFFLVIFFYYLNTFKMFTWFILFIFLILGLFYIISLLFDVNTIKAFFAYSTVINSLTFIILLFTSLS